MTPADDSSATALQTALERIAALEQENKLLRQKIDLLVRRIFGAKSEKLDAAQLELLLTGMEGDPAPGKAEASRVPATGDTLEAIPAEHVPRRSQERRPRLPEHLPVEVEVIIPDIVLAEPAQWRCIGEEVTEQLDITPARFVRRRLIRRKYVSRRDPAAPPVTAPLHILQDRCTAAPGLLAHIIVSKYCDHLPLYRQEQIFKTRHGLLIPRQTQARWLAMTADWLRPLYREIKTTVMDGGCVQIDETPVRYLAPGHGKTKQGYLWAVNRPRCAKRSRSAIFFAWHASRAASCLEDIVPAGWGGKIQCDGYSAYDAFVRTREEPIVLVACMAHIRRGFIEAKEEQPRRTGWMLRQMQHLYALEKRLREANTGPRQRQAHRAAEAAPVLTRIKRALLLFKSSPRHLPQSALGKAVSYALGQWDAMEIYLSDGRVEIDNNLVENGIRPIALGKKNYLFFGEVEAGETSAILYTVIENARRSGLDPQAYLREIFTRLPKMKQSEIPRITPAAWAKAQKAAAASASLRVSA
jgi:transposase